MRTTAMSTKTWSTVAALAVAALCVAQPVAAVEYAADYVLETAEGAFKGRLYATPNKERREMGAGSDASIAITHRDRKLMYTLMPSDRIYVEAKLDEADGRGGDLGQYEVEQTVIGEETVNGVRATKSKVILKERPPKTGKMGGFWWTTREGIVVKVDAVSVEKKSKDRLKMELTNLKVGPQDPRLFEVPAGYTKLDASMPDIGRMVGAGRERAAEDEARKGAAPARSSSTPGDALRDALKLLR